MGPEDDQNGRRGVHLAPLLLIPRRGRVRRHRLYTCEQGWRQAPRRGTRVACSADGAPASRPFSGVMARARLVAISALRHGGGKARRSDWMADLRTPQRRISLMGGFWSWKLSFGRLPSGVRGVGRGNRRRMPPAAFRPPCPFRHLSSPPGPALFPSRSACKQTPLLSERSRIAKRGFHWRIPEEGAGAGIQLPPGHPLAPAPRDGRVPRTRKGERSEVNQPPYPQ